MKIIWMLNGPSGWTYYLESHFAWLPTMLNMGGVFPAIVWLKSWYEIYPVDAKGNVIEMYKSYYTSDPRKEETQ